MKDKKKLDRMTQAIENQARSNYAISFELLSQWNNCSVIWPISKSFSWKMIASNI